MQRVAMFLLALTLTLPVVAQDDPFAVAQKAATAYDAGRYEEAVTLYREFRRMIPRSVSARVQLARALARSNRPDEALALLEEVAAYGVKFDAADPAWNGIRTTSRFTQTAVSMRARSAPLVRSEVAFRLEKDLIPESVAWDPKNGAFFVGSMYKAKIVRIGADGNVTDFIPPRRDGLLGVLGMKVDAAKRELWAVAGNYGVSPPMNFEDPASLGKGAVFRFDLDSGTLIRKYPASTLFNDLVLAPNGDVYVTAGGEGVWRIAHDAATIEPFFKSGSAFFNGITISPDGRTLFGASHFDGVLRIDVATKSASLVEAGPAVTLGGIDGLYVHEGSLVAVQNGTDPTRVIRAWLDPEMRRVTRFAVLEQEHPESDIPLTGVVAGNDLYYIARSQLRAFDGPKIWPMERLKDTVILKLPLDPAGPAAADLTREREALLAMQRGEIRAHVEKNAEWLEKTTGPAFISATRGRISRTTPENVGKFFKNYFEGATYPQYEDLEPPIIRISDDGSMAWIMSRMKVRRIHGGRETSFVYAGVMMYEKRGSQWVRVANASTFEE